MPWNSSWMLSPAKGSKREAHPASIRKKMREWWFGAGMCLPQGQSLRKMPIRQTQKGIHFWPRAPCHLILHLCTSHLSCAVRSLHPALRIYTAGCGRATWEHTDLPGDHRVSTATGLGLTAGSCQPQPRDSGLKPPASSFLCTWRTETHRSLPSDLLGWQVHVPPPLPKELSLHLTALPGFFGTHSLCTVVRFTAHSRALFQSPTCVTGFLHVWRLTLVAYQ